MSKSSIGLSYMLGDTHSDENHILPINSLQHSSKTHNLYSAGRDGVIKTWTPENLSQIQSKLDQCNAKRLDRASKLEPIEDLDEYLLKLEAAVCNNRIPKATPFAHNYAITHSTNAHIDWINDIQLVNNDMGLVSCSLDLSMKYLNLSDHDLSSDDPSTSTIPHVIKFPNSHLDYIKKLSYMPDENRLLSGGLDGKIIEWDLSTLSEVTHFHNTTATTQRLTPDSVYSLASSSSNRLIAAGGPNNTVNLFDTRGSFIKKLIGHQDNIRCLLMDDHYIYSGSSDTTIKVWDIRTYSVLHTLEMHDDSVWSMTLSPESRSLYSGDKSGVIIKTDLSYLSAGNHQAGLFSEYGTYSEADKFYIDEKIGLLTIIAKPEVNNSFEKTHFQPGIIALCVEGSSSHESSLMASTSQGMQRYFIPDTLQYAEYQFLMSCAEYNHGLKDDISDDGNGGDHDLDSEFFDLVSHFSVDTTLDIQLSFSAANHHLPQNEDTGVWSTVFLSTRGGPSKEFANKPVELGEKISTKANPKSEYVYDLVVDLLLNPPAFENVTMVPYNIKPFEKFDVTEKSIIAKRMSNNKRHLVVLYSNGDVKVWDIFICKIIKTFPYQGDVTNKTSKFFEDRVKDMDEIYLKLQSLDTFNNWCDVEIKAGMLLVLIKQTMFGNVKIYYDELIANYPFLAMEHKDNEASRKNLKVRVSYDDRFYLSRIFMNSIFHNYAVYEWDFDQQLRADIVAHKALLKTSSRKSLFGIGPSDEPLDISNHTDQASNSDKTIKRIKMFSRKSSKNIKDAEKEEKLSSPVPSSNNSISNGSIGDSTFYSTWNPEVAEFCSFDADSEQNGPNYHDSVMKLLLTNKNRYREKSGSKRLESLLCVYLNEPKYALTGRIIHPTNNADESSGKGKLIYEPYKPIIKNGKLPSNLLVIISEHSAELGNTRELFSFQLLELNRLKFPSNGIHGSENKKLVKELRMCLPKWIGQPILYDFFPNKEGAKIAFLLVEINYADLPPTKKIGGRINKKIKKLPVGEGAIKLSSHEMLRAGKILSYLTEKFESRTVEMKDKIPPQEWLVLECQGQILSPTMTLQTIKTKIWKRSTEIELFYRRKFDGEEI